MPVKKRLPKILRSPVKSNLDPAKVRKAILEVMAREACEAREAREQRDARPVRRR